MTRRQALHSLCSLGLLGVLAGCAVRRPPGLATPDARSWRGRLAVRVAPAPAGDQRTGQSFSADFDLHGRPWQGSLNFYTPVGTTAAAIRWNRAEATLDTDGQLRRFDSLEQLIQDLLGTDVPVDALFSWLDGQPYEAAGWQADLSQRAQGRITAQRLTSPIAELRVLLEP